MLKLKHTILDRFNDLSGMEDIGEDQLIIMVKREEFGGEFEEVELDSNTPDKSILQYHKTTHGIVPERHPQLHLWILLHANFLTVCQTSSTKDQQPETSTIDLSANDKDTYPITSYRVFG